MAKKKRNILDGIPIDRGSCELCGKDKAVWTDVDGNKKVNVCEDCARRMKQ